jgi:sugar-specific transcriptional regulator TrmB
MVEFLEELGISKKEYKIYRVLNEYGEQTAGELVKRTNIPSSKIYFMLAKLVKKGVITYTIHNSKKRFRSQPPKSLLEVMEARKDKLKQNEIELKETVNTLESFRLKHDKYLDIDVFEGIKGIIAYHDKLLRMAKPGETIRLVGSTGIKSVTLRSYFRHFHDKRIKKGIKYEILKSAKAKRFMEDFPHTDICYLPSSYPTPTLYCIFRNSVSIIIYNVQPTLIRLRNKDLVESFKSYFNAMWRVSKKTK